jgi:hypothetical protein
MQAQKADGAPNNAIYTETLHQYFELNGSWESFDAAITQMLEMQQANYDEVSAEFWEEFEIELRNAGKKDLFELLTPIYQKYFSLEDLQAFVAFYQTPAGKHDRRAPMGDDARPAYCRSFGEQKELKPKTQIH